MHLNGDPQDFQNIGFESVETNNHVLLNFSNLGLNRFPSLIIHYEPQTLNINSKLQRANEYMYNMCCFFSKYWRL
jgi:hypothetical protein